MEEMVMDHRLRIACVAYLHGAGGAERQIIMLANAMAARKHEVHLIVLADNNQKYEIDKRVIIHDLSLNDSKGKLSIINRFFKLKREIVNICPDVSIHFWFQSAYFTTLFSRKEKGKIIYAERGDPGDKEYKGLLGLVRKKTVHKIDGFVFQSEGARDFFDEQVREKSVIIHNAVVVPDIYKSPCEKRQNKILNIGRLHPQKNQKLLIDAFRKIADQLPSFTLEIYGDGSLKCNLEKYISDCDLQDRVHIYPSRKDIFEQLYNASLFVLTSDYEGMPNALMEALALGVPCISTDCKPGGARSLITDGINGFIVECQNVDILSEKIYEVIKDESLSKKFALNGIKIKDTHDFDSVYNMWERKICSVVRKET